jgi:DNA adenine methylase
MFTKRAKRTSEGPLQRLLDFGDGVQRTAQPFNCQLLKWMGNKQRFAHEIVAYFPVGFGVYFEPFLGSGAVLGTLAPEKVVASDVFRPLMEIWHTLHANPTLLNR